MDTILQNMATAQATGPKYRAVAQAITTAIETGDLKAGDRLPPVRDLAWKLGITPGTVARAYTQLTDGGRLVAEVGRGTFVAEKRTPVRDDVWSRQTELMANRSVVSLFSPALPDVGQVAALRAAFARVGQQNPERLLDYPTRNAYRPVREAVVHFLRDVPLGGLSQEDVVLTHGGQNAVAVVMQAILTGPRPVIMVEELSYAGFRRAAETLRAEVVPVPMDEQGVNPEALAAIARRTGAQVLCTSPEVHNPTGLWTPPERRQEIADVAGRLDFQIIEDDCYRMGDAHAPCYRRFAPSRSWYVTSISKTLTPALRVGFAVAPQGRGAELRRMAEYGFFGLAQPLAEVTEILLADPRTEALIVAVRKEIERYVRAAVNVLGAHEINWNKDGPFLWLRLPSGWRAAAFCRAAEAQGVQIRSADEFALRDGRAPHAVRIAVNARVTLEVFEDAMQRLRRLLDNPPEQISV